jgi:hypothetical protein
VIIMAIATWSWIFALLLIFVVQPGFAQQEQSAHRALARRVIEGVFVRGLSEEAKTRNIFIGVAVASAVVLVAGAVSLAVIIRRAHIDHENSDPEAVQVPPVEKPNWWMVEGDSKSDWWRLSLQPPATDAFPVQVDAKAGRTDRLKNAIQRQKTKGTPTLPVLKAIISPADTITLPMQTVPAPEPVQAKYPHPLEKAYPIASYPSLSPPRSYDEKQPKAPAPIIINPSLLRTRGQPERRTGVPRSPAQRRRSKAVRNPLRNPFLPPRTPIISQPMPVNAAQLADPKLAHPLGMPRSVIRAPSRPPPLPRVRPAPLDLDDSGKAVRFGEKF